jgi:alpha-tubulin suppressor-like RCC1 family protein
LLARGAAVGVLTVACAAISSPPASASTTVSAFAATYSCTGADVDTHDLLTALGFGPLQMATTVTNTSADPGPLPGDEFTIDFQWHITLSPGLVSTFVALGVDAAEMFDGVYPLAAATGASGPDVVGHGAHTALPLGDGTQAVSYIEGPFTGTFIRTAQLGEAITFTPGTMTTSLLAGSSGVVLKLICEPGPVVSVSTTPGAPTAVSASASSGSATVSWTAPAFDGGSPVTGYVVTPYIGYYPLPPRAFSSATTTQVISGLSNGWTYRFKVAAFNAAGTGSPSRASNPVTPAPTVPAAPIVGTAIAGDRQATVSWTAPASDGGAAITWYVVTPYIGYLSLGPTWFNSTATTQTITGLTNGTTYRFRVRAYNLLGLSGYSKVSSAVEPTSVTVTGGSAHSCALAASGTVQCWGLNSTGQLGRAGVTLSTSPLLVAGISGATAIDAGSDHTCALVAGGAVKCWGSNSHGQLGNGAASGLSRTPVNVVGLADAVAIAGDNYYTCALLATGAVKCWGENTTGQLGNGMLSDSAVPVDVEGITTATAITAGGGHACALVVGGAVRCWGYNGYGQLGNGTQTSSAVPVAVVDLAETTAIAGGGLHTCALLKGGTVECWGYNGNGQLGNDNLTDTTTPVEVGTIAGAGAISAGGRHACARLSDGTTRCWGANAYGQLGNGTRYGPTTPAPVTGLTGAAVIAAAADHTCAVISGGAVWCWGNNGSGQLGNGTLSLATSPVEVVGLSLV